MKKTISVLLALVLLLGAFPFALPAAAADDPQTYSGTCGSNIEWTLEDGVLTVSGDGAIEPQKRPSTVDNVTWNEATQKIEYTTSPFVSEGSFPWDDVLVRIYTEHFGVDPFSGLLMRYYTDDLTANDIMEFMQEQLDSVRSIVIGEGITSISSNAFSQFLPERIVLPSTLTSIESYAFHAAITTNLVVKNPALDFSQGGISLVGCYNGENAVPAWFASSHAYTHENLRELSTSAMIEMLSDEGLRTLAQAAALIDGYGDAAYKNYVMQPWREYGIETPEELAAKMIEIFNAALGTSYTAVGEILFPVPECTCETCTHSTCFDCKDAGCTCCDCKDFNHHPVELGPIKTLYAYTDAFYEAFYSVYDDTYDDDFIEDRTPHYALGSAPIGEYYDENGSYNVDLTPAPWLTVYGYAGSTAETAAQTSGVNFVSLCPVSADHALVQKAEIAPACTAKGKTAGWYCEDCETYLTGGAEIAATGHLHTATVAETEPTRTAHGYTEGVFCSDCQTYISGHEVIHNQYGERTEIKPATVDEEGEVEIVCTVCGGKGLYALEKLKKAGQKDDDSFFRKLAKGVINFFLRLIKWLGGGK